MLDVSIPPFHKPAPNLIEAATVSNGGFEDRNDTNDTNDRNDANGRNDMEARNDRNDTQGGLIIRKIV